MKLRIMLISILFAVTSCDASIQHRIQDDRWFPLADFDRVVFIENPEYIILPANLLGHDTDSLKKLSPEVAGKIFYRWTKTTPPASTMFLTGNCALRYSIKTCNISYSDTLESDLDVKPLKVLDILVKSNVIVLSKPAQEILDQLNVEIKSQLSKVIKVSDFKYYSINPHNMYFIIGINPLNNNKSYYVVDEIISFSYKLDGTFKWNLLTEFGVSYNATEAKKAEGTNVVMGYSLSKFTIKENCQLTQNVSFKKEKRISIDETNAPLLGFTQENNGYIEFFAPANVTIYVLNNDKKALKVVQSSKHRITRNVEQFLIVDPSNSATYLRIRPADRKYDYRAFTILSKPVEISSLK